MDPMTEILLRLNQMSVQRQEEADAKAKQAAEAQARVAQHQGPIRRGYREEGQKGWESLLRPNRNQQRAMIASGAQMMGRRPGESPGARFGASVNNGLTLLENLRQSDQDALAQQAQTEADAALLGANTAQRSAQGWRGATNAANQTAFATGMSQRPPKWREVEADGRVMLIDENDPSRRVDLGESPNSMKEKARSEQAKSKSEEAESMQLSAAESSLANAQVTLSNIEQAMKQSEGFFATGLPGQVLQDIGGRDAHDLKQTITQLKSTIGFERLQKMRDQSPTGGALGQVSQMELQQLNSALGSLEVSQSEEQLKRNLQVVKDVYSKILGEMNAFIEAKRSDGLDELLQEYQ